ncbi:hypothetical protein HWV23_10370 [Natronomonas halophila]|uniref:DUF7546 family protein n=1 Tax=Natronomonas halophila TaxID=2747817 RepID=UPI0015B4B114|nr:hypothetical protein [Natronomonas halophila]QLD86113.1 hypothetical protein HWV23_10370 [Natronomonas halophila]
MAASGLARPSSVTVPVARRTAVRAVGTLLAVELLAVALYLRVTNTGVLAPRYTLYPFVWINVGVWVLLRRPAVAAARRRRLLAGAVAVAYFLLLAVAGGLLGGGGMSMPARIAWLSPGWGPALLYTGDWVSLTVIPFEVVGYAVLATLVYTVVLAGARSALAGLLGVATCVGCLWPFGAALLAVLGGVGSPLATAVPGVAYDLSTALFLLTVGMLYWAAGRAA